MQRLRLAAALVLAVLSGSGCGSNAQTTGAPDGGTTVMGSGGVTGTGGGHAPPGASGSGGMHGSTMPPSTTHHDAGAALDAGAHHDASTAADTGTNASPDAGDAGATAHFIVYTGGYTTEIDIFTFDPVTLALAPAGNVTTGNGPSFLAIDVARQRLVAVNENADMVESFSIAPGTGALTRIDGESSNGAAPTHITFDKTGAWVLVADYNGGAAAVLPIAGDGSLSPAVTTIMPGSNTHEVVLNAANTVAYIPCLGSNRLTIYDFNATTGALSPRTPYMTASGAGPRHFALSPNGQLAWLVNETNSTVTNFSVDADGDLTAGMTVSTLQSGFSGSNTTAEIAVHPSGKWVYVSNRGDDSIAVFSVGAGGALTLLANTKTGGTQPRHFSLVPGGNAMLVANQQSGTITGFHIDPDTGLLTSAGKLADVSMASFVAAVQLP